MTKRVSIHISGTVQGVGFRPTVYKYAKQQALVGSVNNTAQGVIIVAQGSAHAIEAFCQQLQQSPPPQAKILSFEIRPVDQLGSEKEFSIITSNSQGIKNVHISSDLACCDQCRQEIFDPRNRRFGYPFTNCTNCGPRFTIIKDRPYDRALTSMAHFPMCPQCQAEYNDPLSRRFHAQPNACPQCGPTLHLINLQSTTPLEATIEQLKKGRLAAIKGLGGFNISCDPFNQKALNRLRVAKRRPNKAFAVMMPHLEMVERYCYLNQQEKKWLTDSSAPIVLLRKKSRELDQISPDNNYLGVMLPYTPLHHLLMQQFSALVMTSANLADEPIAINDQEIQLLIEAKIIDFALSNNREILHRADDSILQVIDERLQMIRHSRGFTPAIFKLSYPKEKSILALGANMKNSFALAHKDEVYLSQHIGELIDHRNYQYQKEQIEDFKNLLEIDAEIIHGDAHPGYENYSQVQRKIYHHHAHLLSVIGEHQLFGREILGVIGDGTGFGSDETIWGFEFLKMTPADNHFERVATLQPFVLPGGEVALKDIKRIAIALGAKRIKDASIQMLINKNLNCPRTSSLGRLFDGIAALIGVCHQAEYEARAAIILQKYAESVIKPPKDFYPVLLKQGLITYQPLIDAIEEDLDRGHSPQIIAYKFHQWVVDSIVKIIEINQAQCVAFSGGCFQNRLLIELLNQKLTNVEVYYNQQIPTNDGGIAFGQAVI